MVYTFIIPPLLNSIIPMKFLLHYFWDNISSLHSIFKKNNWSDAKFKTHFSLVLAERELLFDILKILNQINSPTSNVRAPSHNSILQFRSLCQRAYLKVQKTLKL